MQNKRGISAVVATVLIILITVAAVSIIWAAIIPMIRDNLDFSALEGRVSVVTSEGYTVYNSGSKMASVQIKRDVDDGVMNRIRIIFSIDGNSFGSSVVAPDSGGTRVYVFNLSEHGKPESVSVAPIFAVGEREKEGSVTSDVKISEGSVSGNGVVYGVGVKGKLYSDVSEYSIIDDDSDSEYKLMKSFNVPVSASGIVNIKFSGYIQSGQYYWAWKIAKNGGNTLSLAEGGDAKGSFSSHLDIGEVDSVHSYRMFNIDVNDLKDGDLLELWMVSSTGGGTPVIGVGQMLYAKDFEVWFD